MLNNIKMHQFLISFIICLGFSLSQTYNISGVVLDSKTKKPLNKNITDPKKEDSKLKLNRFLNNKNVPRYPIREKYENISFVANIGSNNMKKICWTE